MRLIPLILALLGATSVADEVYYLCIPVARSNVFAAASVNYHQTHYGQAVGADTFSLRLTTNQYGTGVVTHLMCHWRFPDTNRIQSLTNIVVGPSLADLRIINGTNDIEVLLTSYSPRLYQFRRVQQ